jgi:hypothetical protein
MAFSLDGVVTTIAAKLHLNKTLAKLVLAGAVSEAVVFASHLFFGGVFGTFFEGLVVGALVVGWNYLFKA